MTDNSVAATESDTSLSDAAVVSDAAGTPTDDGSGPSTPAAASTTVATSTTPEPTTSLPTLFDVEEAMRDVVDPELGINVVDLGLVYGLEVTDEAVAKIDMTLTSAACPLTDVIEDQARAALVNGGLCTEIEINWVWLPPWGPEKITDDGREQLRALGFTV